MIQIPMGVIATIAIPIMLLVLDEPTRDHILISAIMVPLGIFGFIVGIRELKKLRHTFRYEDTPEEAR
ncbi:hypothetical protein [Arthrobacter sp. 260]|uniref:hypothetical protein n=1 Tax=Arthrobacter sp. 260 TaxID=2735314 RepID=UPI0014925DF9|nr:hypothetical protein [Arthrobacter sp. 260]NOJ61021.1 hypothetical protein [Arthrobacter sp. 260]